MMAWTGLVVGYAAAVQTHNPKTRTSRNVVLLGHAACSSILRLGRPTSTSFVGHSDLVASAL